MFLKRIEVSGFKSFADKSHLVFESDVTGIVGPNGCGKSNVSDAIRWVLGEQSPKSMRGSNMSDVIFAGSEKRRPLSKAEVTLVFDNTKRMLPIAFDEVEITRILYRNNNEAEYLLNKTPCRLKDITTLIMDTGLGRDSLSIISQGNISSFAEAKPEDRRAIFEEAAGVSKYKKRKTESLSKLERTNDNLMRLEDIIAELERQVNPLKRQAEKARIYIEKKAKLEEIEIAVLVDEITNQHEQVENLAKTLDDFEQQKSQSDVSMSVYDARIIALRQDISKLDHEVHTLQSAIFDNMSTITALETRRIEIDEKRKNWLSNHASDQGVEKIAQLRQIAEEARIEFEDRKQRLAVMSQEMDALHRKMEEKTQMRTHAQTQSANFTGRLQRLKNRQEVLSNLIRQPLMNQSGVRSIIDHQRSMQGIEGVVADLIQAKEGFENAIGVALGGALWNVVTTDSAAARRAIEFLKRNESGRATFLPLSVLQARSIPNDVEIRARTVSGYLGKASDQIVCDDKYQMIAASLLANVLVCDTLESANELGESTRYGFKIVTLDGEVVHRGGSMSGGKVRNQETPLTLRKEYETIDADITQATNDADIWTDQYAKLERDLQQMQEQITQKRITYAQLEPVMEAKKSKYERYCDELAQLGHDAKAENEEPVQVADDLIVKLNQAYMERDQITADIQNKRESRMQMAAQVENYEQEMRTIRRTLSQLSSQIRDLELSKARLDTLLGSGLERLSSEYKMTYEYASSHTQRCENILEARQEVLLLRQQIDSLGSINMNAPAEYEEVHTRFQFLQTQKTELVDARQKILDAIHEMDDVMSQEFALTFEKINRELDGTFRQLFGGGHAQLVMVDPSNVLETGIDIDVQPPGKAVKNIRLFSGGEKSLIALSVLFSILKVRIVPLCILDEVEAALDQANVERFARYLKHFSETTQFLVVTHRPGTMARCDVLYGITMQQKGVSQLIRVKLNEAIEFGEKEQA